MAEHERTRLTWRQTGEPLDQMARVNGALRLNRLPLVAAKVLRVLDDAAAVASQQRSRHPDQPAARLAAGARRGSRGAAPPFWRTSVSTRSHPPLLLSAKSS